MFTTLVAVVVGRDLQVVRNIIVLTVFVDMVNFLVFRLSGTALRQGVVPNPLGTDPALLEQSLRVLVIGGVLIVAELVGLIAVLEVAKRYLGRAPMALAYVLGVRGHPDAGRRALPGAGAAAAHGARAVHLRRRGGQARPGRGVRRAADRLRRRLPPGARALRGHPAATQRTCCRSRATRCTTSSPRPPPRPTGARPWSAACSTRPPGPPWWPPTSSSPSPTSTAAPASCSSSPASS